LTTVSTNKSYTPYTRKREDDVPRAVNFAFCVQLFIHLFAVIAIFIT